MQNITMAFDQNIKFKCIVNKLANFYFFVQNLSEWHFSNRKDYNIFWRTEVGPFSSKEEKAIKQFKKFISKYPFDLSYVDSPFFLKKNPWTVLKKSLPKEDFITIRNIFSELENRFNLLWGKDRPLLIQWQKLLDDKLNDVVLIKSIAKILKILFNTKPSSSLVKVYLLLSSPNRSGGRASPINEGHIGLEISRQPIERLNDIMGVVWHETIHSCFQNQYFLPLVTKYFYDQETIYLIEEATPDALFPYGILGNRFLKNKIAYKFRDPIPPKQTIKILNLMKEYIDSKKPLDERYLKRLAGILKKKMGA
jgi:hypothetical protein